MTHRLLSIFLVVGLCLGLWPTLASDAQAQTRKTYALFISGYGKDIWIDSGTPQDWKSRGIIDDYAILDAVVLERLGQLSNIEVQSIDDLSTYLGSRTDELIYELTNLYVQGANADVIVVGHSAGGLLARALTSIVDNYGIPLAYGKGTWRPNIRTVTVATPHQGARIFNRDAQGTADIINSWLSVIERPTSEICGGIAIVAAGAQAALSINLLDELRSIGDRLEEAASLTQTGAGYIDGTNAIVPWSASLKPGGQIVRGINRLPDPSAYISVYGAEKSRIPIRLLSELPGSVLGSTESASLNRYESLRSYFALQRDCWNAAAATYYASLFFAWNGPGARKNANRWKEGERRLKAVDDMWADAIDSYTTETRTGTRKVKVCEPVYDDGSTPTYAPIDDVPMMREQMALRDCNRFESPYEYQTYTYTVRVETKNDGIMGPQYGTWKKSQMNRYDVRSSTSSAQVNAYFSDVPADGGYNHMEIRRSKRAYSTDAFNKGDRTPPFGRIEQWETESVR